MKNGDEKVGMKVGYQASVKYLTGTIVKVLRVGRPKRSDTRVLVRWDAVCAPHPWWGESESEVIVGDLDMGREVKGNE